MPPNRFGIVAFLALALSAHSQPNSASPTKRLMLDRIHPAANTILLAAYRNSPNWTELSTAAKALQSSAAELASQNTQSDWTTATNLLATAAADTAQAALAKNDSALPAIARRIDASCTDCHRRYRPNVFPPAGKGVE